MIPEKGVKELLESIPLIQHKKFKILIVGSKNFGQKQKSEYEDNLRKMAQQYKENIRFTGYIHNDELYKLYNIANIAIFPSIWEEPSGLVILEAMASGTPIITTHSGGIPEIMQDELNGYILKKDEDLVKNIAKKIDYLFEHPEKCEQIKKNNKETAEKFTIKNYYDNYTKALEKTKMYKD